MILDLFAGLIIICIAILIGYLCSLAITFWFISIPLFVLWVWWLLKRAKTRVRKPLSPQVQRDLDRWRAGVEADKRWREHEKAERR